MLSNTTTETITNTLNSNTEFLYKSMEDLAHLPSKWFVSEEQKESQRHAILQETLQQDPRPLIAVVMCVKSQKEWINISDTSLHTLLIPSIIKTVTPQEWQDYRVELFVGFDVGDKFWENRHHRQLLQQLTTQQQSQLHINFLELRKLRQAQIPFNAACRAAYEVGADYIVRINDDTEFLTSGWITMGIQALQQFRPHYFGVVGPKCDQGNVEILTHDMVSRLHLDIFGMQYYPHEFDNWWIDDWISRVYGRNNTLRVDAWEVYHHIDKHGTRYRVDERLKRHLETTIARGRDKIRAFLKQRRHDVGRDADLRLPKSQLKFKAIGNTNRIQAAWGTSMDRFYNKQ